MKSFVLIATAILAVIFGVSTAIAATPAQKGECARVAGGQFDPIRKGWYTTKPSQKPAFQKCLARIEGLKAHASARNSIWWKNAKGEMVQIPVAHNYKECLGNGKTLGMGEVTTADYCRRHFKP